VVTALVGMAWLVRMIAIAVASMFMAATTVAARSRPVARRDMRMRVMRAASERHVHKHGGKRKRSDEAIHECLRLENAS